MLAFLDPVVGPAHALLTTLADALEPALGDPSTGVSIVAFTIGVRLLLLPLSYAAARGTRARAMLAPRIRDLQRLHHRDPGRLRREQAALQREHGVSTLAGLWPALLQLPFFTVMYRLFAVPAVGGHANVLLTHTLFGVPLGEHLLPALLGGAVGIDLVASAAVYVGLFAGLALVAWWSVRQAGRSPAGPQPRVLRLLPFGTLLAAAFLPLAAGLYLLTTTAWSAAERASFRTYAPGPAGR